MRRGSVLTEPITRGLTVADVARRYRIGEDKVRAMIRRGELAAVNTATALCGRPRWVVMPEAIAAFERGARASGPKPKQGRRQQRVPETYYSRR